MELIDFSNYQRSGRIYGGGAGSKKGIRINEEYWFLKFPKSTKGMKNVRLSYTTSPLSEYLGSHIYNIIGIKAHETKLGIYNNKVVVACKDFLKENEFLIPYNMIKNDYQIEVEEHLCDTYVDGDYFSDLDGIEIVMKYHPYFEECKNLKDHFWHMFLIDSFIDNNDRHRENWGVIYNHGTKDIYIPPVYDNGASFQNKADEEKFRDLLSSEEKFLQGAYYQRGCPYTRGGKKIKPLHFIKEGENKDCNKALLDIVPNIHLEEIRETIEEIPNHTDGILVTSNAQKEFYYKSLVYRYQNVLLPSYQKVLSSHS